MGGALSVYAIFPCFPSESDFMHIAIDARLINQTGVGRYIRNLLTEIAKIDKRNKYSVIMRRVDFRTISLPAGFRKIGFDVRWHTVAEQIRMPLLMRRLRPDILHVPYFNFPVLYGGKTVMTIHDLTYLSYVTGRATTLPFPLYEVKKLAYRFVVRQGIFRSTRIIAVSEATKHDILKHFTVPPEKISVIYEGVDRRIMDAAKTGVRQRVLSKPYVLYVGNAYPHKNLETLIAGFLTYLKTSGDRELKLVLVGPDDYFYGRLKSMTEKLPESGRIEFHGPADDAQLASLYAGAACCVFPSLAEGFGLPPLEALFFRTPVICSDIPVFHEILGNRVQYFDPHDSKKLSDTLNAVLRTHNRPLPDAQFPNRFSFRRMAEETLSVYKQSVTSEK